MALTLLLPLMASLLILPRPVTPAAPPPAPRLSQDPRYTVYLPGERVTLTCSAPRRKKASGYRFFYQGQQDPSVVQHPNEGARLDLTAEKGNAGTYTCVYWRRESNREISSRNSSSISITVTETPVAPTLSLSPRHQLYLTGESVWLTCSAPSGDEAITRFQFYNYGGSIRPDVLSNSRAAKFKLEPELHSGSYTCLYWIRLSGREIRSVESAPVSISVTAPLPAPHLTVSPEQPAYVTGEVVNLTCSVAGASTVVWIQFFRDNQRIDTKGLFLPGYGNTDFIQLLGVSGLHTGAYTCDYWKMESGRAIPSEMSQRISVAVTDPPPQPVLELDPPSGMMSEGLSLLTCCQITNSAEA